MEGSDEQQVQTRCPRLDDAELHPPPGAGGRLSPSHFFQIHEKAKIVVIPTSHLRPIKTRRREEVMDRSLQYILQTQRALPIRRELAAEERLSRTMCGPTAPPRAPRALSAVSCRSGRLSTDPAFDRVPTDMLSASFDSKETLRREAAKEETNPSPRSSAANASALPHRRRPAS
ncbi:uncharacterized protein LOC119090626 [Pollicipes pollicipes]|uniref:uncharacterized protein LOC119090626 n=1 Tax=Pollicipes pollicipes TaxID=41117 RepID=UPI0018856360|nr:uncharacterized protein LOC119090626 [Pollicipes pollicipes]